MADTTADTLRKIAAICGPVERSDGYLITMYDCNILANADNILAHARRVLWSKSIDIRRAAVGFYWVDEADTVHGHFPTEAECILAALESVQPKAEPLKNRYTVTSATGGVSFKVYDNSGETISLNRLHALLNAPHYTQADVDEAVAKAYENAANDWAPGTFYYILNKERAAALRKGGAK